MNLRDIVHNKLGEKRFRHTLGVMDTAVRMAKRLDANIEKTEMAALLHDYAKELSLPELVEIAESNNLLKSKFDLLNPQVLHGYVGAFLARKELGINDPEVLEAISCHTLGREGMSKLDKIIFLADMIEPGRSFEGVSELRALAEEDFEEALVVAFDSTISFLIAKRQIIHPQTILSRNALLQEYSVNQT